MTWQYEGASQRSSSVSLIPSHFSTTQAQDAESQVDDFGRATDRYVQVSGRHRN
jgi:hypothetical protein